MYLEYSLVKAHFPLVNLGLKSDQPGLLLWDCHHGDLFVLKAGNLAVFNLPPEEYGEFIRMEISLAKPAKLLAAMEELATRHNLTFDAAVGTLPEVMAPPLLAAAHLPTAKLFIYSEEAELRAHRTAAGDWQLEILGRFKSMKIPSQQTDVLVELDKTASTRLLSHLYYQVRGLL